MCRWMPRSFSYYLLQAGSRGVTDCLSRPALTSEDQRQTDLQRPTDPVYQRPHRHQCVHGPTLCTAAPPPCPLLTRDPMDLNEWCSSGRFLFGGKKVLADFCYLVSMTDHRRVHCSGPVVQEVDQLVFEALVAGFGATMRREGVYAGYTPY